jgi:hypothetical protein
MMPSHDTDSDVASLAVIACQFDALRRDFPNFHIWREAIGDRVRFVAVRRRSGVHPHTVVTADLDELGAVLADPWGQAPSSAPASDPACPIQGTRRPLPASAHQRERGSAA